MICDWWILIRLCVSVFQGSLLVIVIMIDGSEKRNCEGGFELYSSHVCEKRSKSTRIRVHGTFRFLFLSHLLYAIFVKIFNMNRYNSKSYTTTKTDTID